MIETSFHVGCPEKETSSRDFPTETIVQTAGQGGDGAAANEV